MRSKLSTHKHKYIVGKGWITDWKLIPENNVFRAYISKPTIKEPDKHKRYEDLELISREDHINLFINTNADYPIMQYKRYDCVSFAGIVEPYRRKDGSQDWGVKPVPQSTMEYQIQNLIAAIEVFAGLNDYSAKALCYAEEKLKPKLKRIEENLDAAGDLLPTFSRTYDEYKEELADLKVLLVQFTKKLRCIHSSRQLRRKYKVKSNEAQFIPEYLFG